MHKSKHPYVIRLFSVFAIMMVFNHFVIPFVNQHFPENERSDVWSALLIFWFAVWGLAWYIQRKFNQRIRIPDTES